jgi:hypothetical protein
MTDRWQKVSERYYRLVDETGIVGWVQRINGRWHCMACCLVDHRVIGTEDNHYAAMRAVEKAIGAVE